MEVSFRAATPADAAAIRDVARDCWEHDYPEILSRESIREGVAEWYAPDRIRAAVERDDTHVVVVETAAGDVVGFSHAIWDGDVGDVLRLYVAPSERGSGVGSDLLAETVDALRAGGATTIRAMVLAANDPGNEFYRSEGFERVDEGETRIDGETYAEAVWERTL